MRTTGLDDYSVCVFKFVFLSWQVAVVRFKIFSDLLVPWLLLAVDTQEIESKQIIDTERHVA